MDWTLDKKGFTITVPQQYRPWYNYFSNGDYGIKISHTADGYATTLKFPRISVSNYDFFSPCKGRYVYVNDGTDVWAPSYLPCKTKLDSWSCTHEPGSSSWKGSKNGITVTQSLFLPEKGTYEIWLVKVENNSGAKKTVDIFPEMEFLLYNSFGVDPVYYSWYTDSRIENEDTILYERRVGDAVTGFFKSLEKPAAFEPSLKRFFDGADQQMPNSVVNRKLSGIMSGGDPYIGAMQFTVELKPGESHEIALFAGIGTDTLEEVRSKYKTTADAEAVLLKNRADWQKKLVKAEYDSIKDETARSWLNSFFGYQIYQQSTGMVRGTYRGFRDVAQDAIGICKYDAAKAEELLVDLCSRQYKDGRCLRQWNTEGGANDERDFHDLPLWIILALSTCDRLAGCSDIYTKKAKWLDSEEESTLWEHAITGIEYSLKIGKHGLVEMGLGDWNDALSGPGKKGGTTFLNEFTYFALKLLGEASEKYGLKQPFDIKKEMDALYEGTMKYWNGTYFARAVSEDMVVIGCNGKEPAIKDGLCSNKVDNRIYLLPQVWFTICGMADRSPADKEIADKAFATMLSRLESDVGLLKCEPGYVEFDAAAGNISALTPGMAENFAVYNHSAAFAVYALLKAGRTEDAMRIFHKIVPFKKDWRKTKAEPYVLVNFYNGGYYKEKAGEGGIPWLTGTVNWLALSLFDFILPNNIQI